MPVSATEFWLAAIAYIMALILPIIVIRKLSNELSSIRNRFDIISALMLYPFIFILGSFLTGKLHSLFEASVVNIYIGFVFALSVSFLFVWLAQRHFGNIDA